MPAIVKGTVLRWKVDETDKSKPKVVFDTATEITVYAERSDEDEQAILAEFVLRNEAKAIELLKEQRSGLLEVVGIQRMPLSPPPVPSNWVAKK